MKLLAFLAVGLVGGFFAGAFVADDAAEPTTGSAPAPVATYFDRDAPADERIARLEAIVAQEREARFVLEEQIALLLEEVERLDNEGPSVIANEIGQMVAGRQRREARQNTVINADGRAMQQNDWQATQVRQLTASGFAPDRAQAIVDRVSELQWEIMRERYEARSAGTPRAFGLDYDPNWRLRQEIGEREYEQYINALGMPNEVRVASVMASSPASGVGLKPGDVIVSYNGTRVYSTRELQVLSMGATPGQNAVVDVLRDGGSLQLAVPTGPMGVQVRGARRQN